MGRKPLPHNELKKRISVRLRQESINYIKERGSLQDYIENLVENDIKKKKISDNGK